VEEQLVLVVVQKVYKGLCVLEFDVGLAGLESSDSELARVESQYFHNKLHVFLGLVDGRMVIVE
jgi:hypothetical protein